METSIGRLFLNVLLFLALTIFHCVNSVKPTDAPEPVPLPSHHISIADSITTIYRVALENTHNPKLALAPTISFIKSQSAIGSYGVAQDSNEFWIEFADSGKWLWSIVDSVSKGAIDKIKTNTGSNNLFTMEKTGAETSPVFPSGNKAALISIFNNTSVDKNIKTILESRSYNVESFINEKADVSLFHSLQDYDFVYINTHGGVSRDNGKTYIETGEWVLPELGQHISEILSTLFLGDYKLGNLFPHIEIIKAGAIIAHGHWAIHSGFIANSLKDFRSGSGVIVAACKTLVQEDLGNAFLDEGASVFVGAISNIPLDERWDGSEFVIWDGMAHVFDYLAGTNQRPLNVADAIANFPLYLGCMRNSNWCLMPHLYQAVCIINPNEYNLRGFFGDDIGSVLLDNTPVAIKVWTNNEVIIDIGSKSGGNLKIQVNGLSSNPLLIGSTPNTIVGYWNYDFENEPCLKGLINFKADGTFDECWNESCDGGSGDRGSVNGNYTTSGNKITWGNKGEPSITENFNINGDILVIYDPNYGIDAYSYHKRATSTDCP